MSSEVERVGQKREIGAVLFLCFFSAELSDIVNVFPLFCVSPVRPSHSVSASWRQSSFCFLFHGLLSKLFRLETTALDTGLSPPCSKSS